MKKQVFIISIILLSTFLAGLGAGYLIRGEQSKTPIIIEKNN